jgi:integrase
MAYFRKRKGKKGITWQAVIRMGGCRPQSATFRTKGEAEDWARETETAISKGKYLPSFEAKRRTVKDLLERYKQSEIPKKKDQANPTRQADFWIDRLGELKLFQLTRSAVVEVRDELAKERAPGTVNRYLALLSHACTMAEREWEWLDTNPLRKVRNLEEPRGLVRFLSNGEKDRLLDAARNSSHPHLYVIVLIALTTGARKGEILGLHWKDIDLDSCRAVLHNTKNNERRTLTLVGQVVDELRMLQKIRRIDDDLIFTNLRAGTANSSYFEKAWQKARGKAELKDFRFHDLRHTCASNLAMNGATTAELAAVLGHKTLEMVKRYSHLSDEHVRGVVERTAMKVLANND